MEYFEDGEWSPGGSCHCGDPDCPCHGSVIDRGEGYLYVSPEVAEFRGVYRTHAAAKAEMDKRVIEKYGRPISYVCRFGPLILCRAAAKKLGIDLDISHEDAKFWWTTGQAPLRATPKQSNSIKKKIGKEPDTEKRQPEQSV